MFLNVQNQLSRTKETRKTSLSIKKNFYHLLSALPSVVLLSLDTPYIVSIELNALIVDGGASTFWLHSKRDLTSAKEYIGNQIRR